MNKEKIITIVAWIVFLTLAIGGLYFYTKSKSENTNTLATSTSTTSTSTISSKYDDFAKCLTIKGAVMYGAVWCSHCKAQKEEFGSSFQYIKYVECPDNVNFCLDKGVNGYPTWIFADGHRVEGETSLENLAKISGCELPK